MYLKKIAISAVSSLFAMLIIITISNRSEAQSALQNIEKEFIQLVQKVNPAIVEVRTIRERENPDRPIPFSIPRNARPPGGQMLRPSAEGEFRRSIGSGIIIDKRGYIITTANVVQRANKIEISLYDGRTLEAKLIGLDPQTDVAVLKIEAKNLSVAMIGDSDDIMSGSWVITVGKSYGLSPTLSFGIVSGFEPFPGNSVLNAIKMNAAVNPGNSGGAVVNTSGQVVGVIAATLAEPRIMEIQPHLPPSAPDQNQRGPRIPPKGDNPQLPNEFRLGIDRMRASFMDKRETSFAIPINEVNRIAKVLIQYGQVQRGWLGIEIQVLPPEYRQTQPLDQKDQRGVLVKDVRDSSPADKAGIRKGDMILEFDGKPIYSPRDLRRLVSQQAPGNEVKIKFYRENKEQSITVKLGIFPKD